MKFMINFNKNILLFSVLLFCKQLGAQPYDWAWAQNYGDADNDAGVSIALDNSGNSYVCGYFSSPSISFGNYSLTNSNLAGGVFDSFVAKFNNLGVPLWAIKIGGTSHDNARSIAVDQNGCCYVTGNFESTSLNVGGFVLSNPGGSSDVFVARISPVGLVNWVKQGEGGGGNFGRSIAVDSLGNSYFTGQYSNQFQMGTLAIGGLSEGDGFVGKLDIYGTPIWLKKFGAITGSDYGNGICVDEIGNIFVTGTFRSDYMTIGSLSIPNSDLTGNSSDLFLAKYDSLGNAIWAIPGGENYRNEYGTAISCDAAGNVFATGYFGSQNLTFQSTNLVNTSSNGTSDVYLVKYNSAGNLQWARSAGGLGNDYPYGICNDSSGNAYIIGSYENQAITFGSTSLLNSGLADIFVAKYDNGGNLAWAVKASSPAYDLGLGIDVDNSGSCYVTGNSSYNATFGNLNLPNIQYSDMFLASLSLVSELDQTTSNKEYIISPNPSSGKVTVFFTEEQFNSSLRIVDVLGKKVSESTFSGRQIMLDQGLLAPGIYWLQVTNKSETLPSKKLIVK